MGYTSIFFYVTIEVAQSSQGILSMQYVTIDLAGKINYPDVLRIIDKYYTVGIRGTAIYLQDGSINFFNHSSALAFAKIVRRKVFERDLSWSGEDG
jgi:hypothetical protein